MELNLDLNFLNFVKKLDIKEITYYGFTTDNTKRPSYQKKRHS